MDAREVIGDTEEYLRAAFEGMQKNVWTAMPCIVAADTLDGHIVSVQVAIQGLQNDQTGKQTKSNITLINDVPIHFGGGGNVSMTHPVKKGDEGVVMFMSRNQDSWYQSGGVQPPLDTRMHHLSDARYIPGGRSIPRKLSNVSNTAYQMRSDDGQHSVSLDPASGITVTTPMHVNINAQTGTSVTAPQQAFKGTLTVTGEIILNGIKLSTHVHSGIVVGPSDTGPPVGGS